MFIKKRNSFVYSCKTGPRKHLFYLNLIRNGDVGHGGKIIRRVSVPQSSFGLNPKAKQNWSSVWVMDKYFLIV